MEPITVKLNPIVSIVIEEHGDATVLFKSAEYEFSEKIGPQETMGLLIALKMVHENQNTEPTDPPFYCLDEGDDKPRCQVQCPFCENLC